MPPKEIQKTQETVANLLAQLLTKGVETEELLRRVLESTGEGSATDSSVARLVRNNSSDIVLVFDIRAISKDGEIVRLTGENALPQALEEHMLGQTHENFSRILDASIVTPLTACIQNHLSKLATTGENLPRISTTDHTYDYEEGGTAGDPFEL